nr:hypothetical protein [uncultured Draconibacterium sp.]
MTEEIRGHFTPRFVLTPYNGACGSDFLSNLNASRSARHLKVGLKAGQQPLGVSQTLKVSIQDYTSSATARFHREGIEFADGRGNLTGGIEKVAKGNKTLSGGNKKTAGGRKYFAEGVKKIAKERVMFADGDRKIAGGQENLPGEALNHPVSTKNCPGTAQVARWEPKTTRGRLRMVGEHEKWFGDGSGWSVSTSFGTGTAQTTRGRVNSAWGAVNMRVSVLSVSNTSRTERHLKVSQAMTVQPLGVSKTLKVSETEHSSVVSTKDEERSVTVEQQSSRFLNRSSLGMTEDKGENFTPGFGLTPYNGACGLNCPPTGRGTSGAGGFEEDPAEVGGDRLAARSPDVLSGLSLRFNSQLAARKKLTIEYNNPPSKRIAGTTKNAQFSKMEMGTRDNKLFPFFLISSTLYISSPAGGSPEGEGGNGTVANINKASAYET